MDNDEVLFQWCMLTTGVSDSDGALVLEILVKLWVTIRGFSFAGAWLKQFKQRKKKTLQKSKALRKDLLHNIIHVYMYLPFLYTVCNITGHTDEIFLYIYTLMSLYV